MRLRGRHYHSSLPIDVLVETGFIRQVSMATGSPVDHEADWIAPAFFDLQINGCDGVSFNSDTLTTDNVSRVVAVCRLHGIAQFCPTLVTHSFESLRHGFATLARCQAKSIPVFHLEGPYISPHNGPRGAHPAAHVRPPDWDEFQRLQEAAEGRIRLVTLAPEQPGSIDFIQRLRKTGVVVAIGHTAASSERIREAVSAGATLGTHLGNGLASQIDRHQNPIWPQLAADGLTVSLIADGHHLPAHFIRTVLKVKGPQRVVLTCDAGSLAGLPPGRYSDWGGELEVLESGRIVVPGTPYLAGSGVFTDACVAHMLDLKAASLAAIVDMAGAVPRRLLGLPPSRIATGEPARLILFDWAPDRPFELKHVIA